MAAGQVASCSPDPVGDQAVTVTFLSREAEAPPVETHISYIFLGQDTVWKLKKAVRLPFLDFTRLEDRHRFCQRELALNAPAAPGLYRDVIPVVRHRDGLLGFGGDGEVLDWVVRMARVPAGDFLDVLAAEGGLTPPLLDQIADAVAEFHMSLPPVRGVRPNMETIAQGNVPSALSAGLPEDDVIAWRDAMLAGLGALAGRRDARAASGFVRRCHGDALPRVRSGRIRDRTRSRCRAGYPSRGGRSRRTCAGTTGRCRRSRRARPCRPRCGLPRCPGWCSDT